MPDNFELVITTGLQLRNSGNGATWTSYWTATGLKTSRIERLENVLFYPDTGAITMTIVQRERGTLVEWFKAEEELLAELRPGAPFDARASFQAFGERQFGDLFAGVAYCCELPGEFPRRWEAALELRGQKL